MSTLSPCSCTTPTISPLSISSKVTDAQVNRWLSAWEISLWADHRMPLFSPSILTQSTTLSIQLSTQTRFSFLPTSKSSPTRMVPSNMITRLQTKLSAYDMRLTITKSNFRTTARTPMRPRKASSCCRITRIAWTPKATVNNTALQWTNASLKLTTTSTTATPSGLTTWTPTGSQATAESNETTSLSNSNYIKT